MCYGPVTNTTHHQHVQAALRSSCTLENGLQEKRVRPVRETRFTFFGGRAEPVSIKPLAHIRNRRLRIPRINPGRSASSHFSRYASEQGTGESANRRRKGDSVCQSIEILTVEMLLLRAYHLLGGGFADRFREALPGDAVPRCQQPVVYRLSRHTVVAAVTLEPLPSLRAPFPILTSGGLSLSTATSSNVSHAHAPTVGAPRDGK